METMTRGCLRLFAVVLFMPSDIAADAWVHERDEGEK
jgi:hypothetical protein